MNLFAHFFKNVTIEFRETQNSKNRDDIRKNESADEIPYSSSDDEPIGMSESEGSQNTDDFERDNFNYVKWIFLSLISCLLIIIFIIKYAMKVREKKKVEKFFLK